MEQIKKTIPFLKTGLVCLLIFSSFQSVLQQFLSSRQLINTDGPFFNAWEKRFDPIKDALPLEHGIIGYAAEWDIPEKIYDPADTLAEHILTQFTMAPIVVSRNTDLEWVIVNMSQEDFNIWVVMQKGELEVTKYKYNLYLVHRIE